MQALSNFTIQSGKPNFLMGIAGNGLSTKLQQEKLAKGVSYMNFINLSHTDESHVLLEFVNAILDQIVGLHLTPEMIDGFHTPFNIFKAGVDILQDQTHQDHEVTLVFDEFNRIKNFSNAFFFTLDKIVTMSSLIKKLKLTTIFISDEFIDPYERTLPDGLRKLFLHHFHVQVIPALRQEQVDTANLGNVPQELLNNLFDLAGGNPSLLVSLCKYQVQRTTLSIDEMLQDYEVEWKIHEILESLGSLQLFLKSRGQLPKLKNLQRSFLVESGVLNSDGSIKSKLLQNYISKTLDEERNNELRSINIAGQQVNLADLSPTQEKILLLLHDNAGFIVTREDLAECIWGSHHHRKYSDYAIDKHISKLRKAIKNEKIIKTRKGKGYIFLNENQE